MNMEAKILEHLILSPFLFGFFILVGLVICFYWKKSCFAWILSLCILLLFFSSKLFFYLFSLQLQNWTPPSEERSVDAIVVALAGIHETGIPTHSSITRIYAAAQLYHKGLAPLLLISGDVNSAHPSYQYGAKIILKGMGVPDDAVIYEYQSFDTHTNGTMSAKILKEQNIQNILLVSHDYHLYRLFRVFQKQGFNSFVYAANPWNWSESKEWWKFLSWENFNRIRTVAHEYIGLLSYWFLGYI